MSQTIDTKVVEMEFDNRQFEKNVDTSLKTIDKLKKSLQFDKTSDGLEQVGKNIKKLDFSQASQSVIVLQEKFSAFERMAIGALEDLGRSIEQNLVQKIKSVTIDPVTQGWQKYADKTSAVQTIIAATGKGIDEVNDQLNKLNWFTDETSYRFLDMVQNIGKFTANQIPLEKSVTAMQGISTWAAVSGANVNEAGRAMYNLSQAMAVGAVKLMDWKSIENANMATAEFKQTAIDTAVELGTLTKVTENTWKTIEGKEVTIKNFNQTLQHGWFTSEVLLDTLDKYGGFAEKLASTMELVWENSDVTTSEMLKYIDQYIDGTIDMNDAAEDLGMTVTELEPILKDLGSETYELGRKSFKAAQEAKTFSEAIDSVTEAAASKWMYTFELIFGNYEEAKELWTDLANTLYDAFVQPLDDFNTKLEKVLGKPLKDKVLGYKDLFNLGLSESDMDTLEGTLTKMARQHGIAIDKMIKQDGSFRETLKRGWLTNDMFGDLLGKVTGEQVKDLDKIHEAARDVIRGVYGNDMPERMRLLTEAGYDAEAVQNYVNTVYKLTDGNWDLMDSVMEAADAEMGLNESLVELSDSELESLGYTEEQIKLLRELQKQAEETGTPISELLAASSEGPSGRELLLEGFSNILGNLLTIMEAVKEAWAEVFPPATVETLYSLLEKFHDLSERLKINEETAEKLKNVFKGLFSILSIAKQVISAIADAVLPVLGGAVSSIAGKILDAASAWGEWMYNLANTLQENQTFVRIVEAIGEKIQFLSDKIKEFAGFIESKFRGGLVSIIKSFTGFDELDPRMQNIFDGIYDGMSTLDLLKLVLGNVKDRFENLFNTIKNSSFADFLITIKDSIKELFNSAKENVVPAGLELIKNAFEKIGEFAKEAGKRVGEFKDKVKNAFTSNSDVEKKGSFFENLSKIFEKLANIGKTIFEYIGKGIKFIADTLAKGDIKTLFSAITAFVTAGTGAKLIEFINGLKKGFDDIKGGFGFIDGIKGLISGLGDTMKSFQDKVKIDTIKTIALSIAILAGSIFVLSTIDSKKLDDSLAAVSVLIAELVGAMAGLGKTVSNTKFKTVTGTMIGLAAAILILAVALKKVSSIEPDKMAASIGVLTGLLAGMIASMAGLSKFVSGSKFKGVAATMVGLAAAILILAVALKKISSIESDKLVSSLISIVVLIGSMTAAMSLLGKSGGMKKGAMQMILFAAAILILTKACKSMSSLSWEEIAKGLVSVGALMAGIIILMRTMGSPRGMISTGLGMIAIAVALKMMVSVCQALGEIETPVLVQGLLAITALLVGLGAFTKLGGGAKGMISTGIAMIAMAAALKLIVGVVESFGNLSNEQTFKGLLTMASALAIISVAMRMIPVKETLLIGGALLILSVGLYAMTGVLKILGSMKWGEIAKGLVALSGALIAISIAATLAGAAIPGAIAITIVAAALLILVPSLMLLSTLSWESIGKIVVALVGFLAVIGLMSIPLASVSPMIIAFAVALGILGAACLVAGIGLAALGGGIYAIGAAFSLLGSNISTDVPAILSAIHDIVIGAIAMIGEVGPQLIDSIIAIGSSIVERRDEVATIVTGLVGILIEVLTENIPSIVEGLMTLVTSVLGSLADHVPEIVGNVFDLINGVLAQLSEKVPELAKTLFDILINLFDSLTEKIPEFEKSLIGTITSVVTGAFDGLTANVTTVVDKLFGFLTTSINALTEKIPELVKSLSGIVTSIFTGLQTALSEGGELLTTIGDVAEAIGKVIGNFIGGIISETVLTATESLADVGTNLANFATNAEPFFASVKTNGTSTFDAIGSLAGAILTLTASNILEGIGSFISGSSSIDTFSEMLPKLGTALTEYANNLGDSLKDESKVKASTNLASMLADLTSKKVSKTGGLVQLITGESSLKTFVDNIPGLGSALTAYADGLGDSLKDDSKIKASATLATMLADLVSKDIPKEGGLLQLIVGESGLKSFVDNIPGLGSALSSYASSLDDSLKDEGKITASGNLASILADLASKDIPKEGGLLQLIIGESGLKSFIDTIPSLGSALTSYADNLGDSLLEGTKVEASTNLASMLATLASQDIPSTGGLLQLITGESGLTGFADSLPGLGAGLTGYADSLGDSLKDKEKVDASTNLASMLATLASQDIPSTGGLLQLITGESGINGFAASLPGLGEALTQYADNLGDSLLNTDKIDASTNAAVMLSNLASSLKDVDLGEGLFEIGDLSLFSAQVTDLGYALEILAGTGDVEMPDVNISRLAVIIDAIDVITEVALNIDELLANGDRLKEFGPLLTEITNWPWNEIEAVDVSNLEPLKTTLEELSDIIESEELTEAKEKITAIGEVVGSWTELLEAFQGAGENIGLGLVQGINSTDVSQAAYDLAQAFLTEFKNELVIESPSKVMEEMGGYIDEGLAIGVTNNAGQVETAASELGGTLTETLSETTDSLPEAITDPAAIQTAFQGLLAAMGASVDGNVGILLNAFKGVGDTVVQYLAGSKDIFRSIGYESVTAYSGGVQGTISSTKDVMLGILETLQNYKDVFKKEAMGAGGAISTEFGNGISTSDNKKHVQEQAQIVGDTAAGGFKSKTNRENAGEAGGVMSTKFGNSINTRVNKKHVQEQAQIVGDKAAGGFKSKANLVGSKNAGKENATQYGDGLAGKETYVSTKGKVMAGQGRSGASEVGFANTGKGRASEFGDGLVGKNSYVKSKGESMAKEGRSGAAGVSFYSTGENAAIGFGNGLTSTDALGYVKNNSVRVADEARTTMENRLEVRSPSKVTRRIGAYFTEGFANGITSCVSKAKNAVSNVTDVAIDGITTSVSSIADIVENGLNSDPIIRPVLDLSDVKAGASAIDGYLSFGTPYSVMANVNGIDNAMNSRQRRMSSADVVDAINQLKDNMPEGSGNTYNVNGVTYDDGTNVADAVRSLIRAANINRRS